MVSSTLTRPARPRRQSPTRRTYTHNELFAMEDEGKAFELDAEGHLEERHMGALSSETGMNMGMKLGAWRDDGHPGRIYGSDLSLSSWLDAPRRLRRPDVSFVSQARLPGGKTPVGVLTVAPDLVVECVSPHDIASTLERKVAEYLAAGVRLVWVIYPEERRAMVRRPDGTATVVSVDDHLEGEDVLPGFRVRLRDVIPDA